jgi:hypothetical protein
MRSKLALVAAAAIVLGLTGCAPTVALEPAAHASNTRCASVIADISTTVTSVSTLTPRETNAQGTAAWGDPADILLRCGVPVPDPTASFPCVTVNNIDWLRNDTHAPVYVFTTYGRNPAVAVTINSKSPKADANQALTDIASVISDSIPSQHRCSTVSQRLQNGEPVTSATPTPAPTSTPAPASTPAN